MDTRISTYHGSVGAYVIGFVGSLITSISAYYIVVNHLFSSDALGLIVALALIQLVIQLVYFLHITKRGEVWHRVAVLFTLIILCIIVAGSLWIMTNLNERMMLNPSAQLEYVQNHEGM